MKRLSLFVFGILSLGIILASPQQTLAQEGTHLRIQPAILEEKAEPGTEFQTALRVTNEEGVEKKMFLFTRDIDHVEDNGQPIFSEEKNSLYGVADWITLKETSITLKPGETKEVSLSISIPKDAAPGGHFGGVFFSGESINNNGILGAAIGYEVGSIIALRVGGDITEEARIREFRNDKGIYKSADVQFSIKVENLGNVLIRPRGPVEIRNMFGQIVSVLTVNDEFAAIFPGASREFQSGWQDENLHMGRYQATMSLGYGESGSKTISATISFWIIPLHIILPFLIGITVIIGGAYVSIKLYIRKKIRDSQGGGRGTKTETPSLLPSSRFLFLTLGVLFFTLAFLIILFLLFS